MSYHECHCIDCSFFRSKKYSHDDEYNSSDYFMTLTAWFDTVRLPFQQREDLLEENHLNNPIHESQSNESHEQTQRCRKSKECSDIYLVDEIRISLGSSLVGYSDYLLVQLVLKYIHFMAFIKILIPPPPPQPQWFQQLP